MRYIGVMFIDGEGYARQTGVCAEWDTNAETTAAFESLRPHSVPINRARFLVDLWDGEGHIIDTIPILIETYVRVTQEPFRGSFQRAA